MSDYDRERLEALKVKIAQKMAQEPGSSLNPVLTEEQVSGFERDYLAGNRLPEGYRLFLLEIGNGGFGPGVDYSDIEDDGLFGPMEPLPLEPEDYYDMDRWHPDRPWPFIERVRPNDGSGFANRVYNDGTLFVCNWGCGESTALVVTGADRGHVWFLAPINQIAIPEIHSDEARLDFLAWYDLWLDGRDEIREMYELMGGLIES